MTLLGRAVARGAVWTYGTSLAVLVAQVAYTAATSRLVDPAGFGAYATALALVSFVSYFTLASLGSAVTRAPVLGPAHRWSAVALALAGGAVGGAALWMLAPVWAILWSSPSSVPVVRALMLTTAVSPLTAVCVGLLRRAMRLRRAAAVECAGALSGMVVGLVLVLRWHDAQALALGIGFGAIATCLLAMASGLQMGPVGVDVGAVRSLFSFAGQVSAQNLVYFAVNTAPTWWTSRAAGAAGLGQFSRANLIVGLPLTQLASGFTKSLFPAYARVQGDLERMRGVVTDALIVMSGLGFMLFAGLAGSAPVLVPLLLGPRWDTAVALLPAFAMSAAVNIVFVVLANAFEARAMLRVAWKVQITLAVALAATLGATAAVGGPLPLVALSLGVAYGAAHVHQLTVASRDGLVDLRRLLPAYGVHGAIAVGLAGALWLTSMVTVPAGLLPATVACILCGLIFLGCLCLARYRLPAYRSLLDRGLLTRSAPEHMPAQVG